MNSSIHLAQQFQALRDKNPKLRIRDAALQIGCSELALVLLDKRTTQLRSDPKALLSAIPSLGRVMSLTRNLWCVQEQVGVWHDPSFHAAGSMGLVTGPEIDLRLFLRHWIYLIHTSIDRPSGVLNSFQIFDAQGDAVHKIYQTEHTDMSVWNALVKQMTEPTLQTWQVENVTSVSQHSAGEIRVEDLRRDWAALQDTHDVHGLLRRHGVSRIDAVRHLGSPWAVEVDGARTLESLLHKVVEQRLSFMTFTGSRGCIQIFTGEIRNVVRRDQWLNILDPDYSVHINLDGIHAAWIVRKPTADGFLHSLELFSHDGEMILQLYGARKPGQPERKDWCALATSYRDAL